jgi:tetratricopeptide (TPR) repeat protein
VHLRADLQPGGGAHMFVTREGGGLRLRALGELPAELGCEALHLSRLGDKRAAGQWLEWARGLVGDGNADDPVQTDPFARLWASGKGDVELAAAALCGEGTDGERALAVLTGARAKASGDLAGTLDHALFAAYRHADRGQEALDAVERLEKAYPASPTARRLVYGVLGELERYDALVGRAKRARADRPDDATAFRALVQGEIELGHAGEAYKVGEALIASGKAEAEDYNNQAWLSLFTGSVTDKDLGYALRAVQAEPRDAARLNTLSAVYAELGRAEDARETLQKLLPLQKDEEPQPADWYVVGRLAERLGLAEDAKTAYARVPRPEKRRGFSAWALAQKRLKALVPAAR